MLLNNKLKNIAGSQFGYFTAKQAEKAGYINQQQFYHASCGNWLKVERGLFRLRGFPDSDAAERVRWTLWSQNRQGQALAVVSHESALHYYGLGATPEKIHLTVPVSWRKKPGEGCILHYARLNAAEQSAVDHVTFTTPARTLLDLMPDLLLQRVWGSTVRRAQQGGLLSSDEAQLLFAKAGGTDLPAGQTGFSGRVAEGRESLPVKTWFTEEAPSSGVLMGVAAEKEGVMMGSLSRARVSGSQCREWRVPNRSFTLIEMLVVIAIICVLAGMLMPALQKAVETSRQAACANNLRQCGIAIYQYADVSGGFTINLDGIGHTARNWPDQLMATGCMPNVTTSRNTWAGSWSQISGVPVNNVFSCPSTPPPARHTASGTAFTGGAASSALCYGVRSMSMQYRYPGESMTQVTTPDGTTVNFRFQTAYTKAPFLGDSIRLQLVPDNVPGQGGALGYDQSAYYLNNAGNLYIGHGLTGNAWYSDGRVESGSQEDYFMMRIPMNGSITNSPILAYPCLR